MLYGYTDYRLYLKNVLAERISKNPGYSLRAMARNLEVSPALLSQISNGRRNLTVMNAVRFSKKLGHSRRESDYFCSLVQYQDAKHTETKALLLEKIKALKSGREVHNVSVEAFKALSEWYHFAIVESLRIKKFHPTPKNLARLLGISSAEAETALERLVSLGILEPLPGGYFRKTRKSIVVESKDKNLALQSFHRQLMEKAVTSLVTQTPRERHMATETFALDLDQIPEAQRRINEFLDDMAEFFGRGDKPTEVYHLGVQMFRLSRKESV